MIVLPYRWNALFVGSFDTETLDMTREPSIYYIDFTQASTTNSFYDYIQKYPLI